ncbi:MAG TPA: hypothetical protein VFI08_07665, partial [Spirochaetia bacterium]|nr:hypothetical protein [Spirochaetia bacterium]
MIAGDLSPAPAGYLRLVLVRQGIVRLAAGGAERTLLPRSVVVISAGAQARLAPAAGASCRQVAFCRTIVEPTLLGSELDAVLAVMRGAREAPLYLRLAPDTFRELEALCARIQAEGSGPRPGSRALQRLYVLEALVRLSRCRQPEGSSPGAGSVEGAVDFVRQHSSEDLSLATVAARFRLNPSYLSRAFHRSTGVHFVEF